MIKHIILIDIYGLSSLKHYMVNKRNLNAIVMSRHAIAMICYVKGLDIGNSNKLLKK